MALFHTLDLYEEEERGITRPLLLIANENKSNRLFNDSSNLNLEAHILLKHLILWT